MSSNFNSSPDYWLDMSLIDMYEWAIIANRMAEKEKEKQNTQQVGPGL